ncbi:hypothetical protein OC846_003728 [Tilletia horrida]|uniref:Aromatic-L-amino-acid decarboxylase n=1 Tax=Tilletia horrida TaxID=155126 RepID=A0AAN6GPK1_9BASI|nr:hypothetical protein OC846_003728 [Tilletia horrida]KAK0565394.1 hypothetical protein OC861_003764 [Tilletia horrida]
MLDTEGFRRAGHAAIDAICDYYKKLDELPVQAQVEPGFLWKQLPHSVPEEGESWSEIDKDFHKIIMPGMTNWQSGSFAAYFPGNATFEGALGDLYANAVSNPGFNWACSPSVTELEILTVDWWAKMLGLDPAFWSNSLHSKGGGVILGSATEACLTVAIAARERAISALAKTCPPPAQTATDHQDLQATVTNGSHNAVLNGKHKALPNGGQNGTIANGTHSAHNDESESDSDAVEPQGDFAVAKWRGNLTSRLVLYATTQTHSIACKVASLLGLAFRALEVRAEDAYALRGHTLKAALEEDTKAGRVPFMLGTTSSGAVDNITEVGEVARHYPNLWLHVDAAYAGVALALPELRQSSHLEAINAHVDSFSTSAHKWGLVQLECSPLHVKDRGALTRALTITPEFLRTKEGDAGSVLDLRNMQLSVGRRFRSLKLWFVLRSYGVKGFQAHLRHGIACAKIFETTMRKHGHLFEFVAPPRWSLNVFRLNPDKIKGLSEALDKLNEDFMARLNARSAELTLTQTRLPEIGFCIRYAIGSPQLQEHHVHSAFQVILECANDTLKANQIFLTAL